MMQTNQRTRKSKITPKVECFEKNAFEVVFSLRNENCIEKRIFCRSSYRTILIVDIMTEIKQTEGQQEKEKVIPALLGLRKQK